MLQRATSTDTTVASAQDDEISDISLQTRHKPLLAEEEGGSNSINAGIPTFICFLTSIKQTKQEVPTRNVVDRPRRKLPRGAMQQVTIGQLVGESALVTPCCTAPEVARRQSCFSIHYSSCDYNNNTTEEDRFVQSCRANNRKLDSLVSDKPPQRRRRRRRQGQPSNHHYLAAMGELLYLVEGMYKPIQERFRRRSFAYDLHPSQHGCLV